MPVPEEAPAGVLAGLQKAPSYLITWDELQKDPSLAVSPLAPAAAPRSRPAGPLSPAVAPDKVFQMQTGPGGVTRWVSTTLAAPAAERRQPEQVRVVAAPPLPQQDVLSRTVFPQGYTMVAAAPAVAAK